ncbi:toll/interleukin-1 receptor domain-containing protein [Parvularcula maris]|uniref:Toll/interleukin-1 receptor domain-containing protein n=1 Tax=Parvularcula maris TaxID=2965077 RepID=A0A9X2L9B5_9PROT|nr:toll/interleukin-1 receptor domain-containing protein [Parvularcula maris]MCQ8185304.1 toll/interleukin-1 receptor domain-containing protein [Parvularcula maris]
MVKVFLSHNHNDKPLVEPIAVRLRHMYGQDAVFYDSWSMQPGDGIIAKMNEGMNAPDFFFLFVSRSSMASKMVQLEWHAALMQATSGNCRIIPVRMDGCEMPPLLMQSVYIDLHTKGVERAIHDIESVISGSSTFKPSEEQFENLSFHLSGNPREEMKVKIRASHLLEPHLDFVLLTLNNEDELELRIQGNPMYSIGFNPDLVVSNFRTNGFTFTQHGGVITPQRPLLVDLVKKGPAELKIVALLHRGDASEYRPIPQTGFWTAPNRPLIEEFGVDIKS